MNVLQLGIPKGSLESATVELFRRSGWKISTDSRSYFPSVDDPALRCLLVRAQEMARYVESGSLDAGITGRDWVLEHDTEVVVAQELVYSKASLRPTRWVLVVGNDSPVKKPEDLQGARIATELVEYTKRWFAQRKIDVQIEFSWGATEAKVAEGLVDAIVEVTETGSTIRAHGLRIVAGDDDSRCVRLDRGLDRRLLCGSRIFRARGDNLRVAEFGECDLAAPVGDDLVRVERVLRDVVVRLAGRRMVRRGERGRNGDACHEDRNDGGGRPSALVHR